MGIRRGLVAVLVACAAAPAPAAAVPEPAPVKHVRGDLVDPQLVPGGGVAWMDTACVRNCDTEADYLMTSTIGLARRDGSGRRELLRRRYRGEGGPRYGFALSRGALGVMREYVNANRYFPDAPSTYGLDLAVPGGATSPDQDCRPAGPALAAGAAGVLFTDRCPDGLVRLVVRAPGGARRVVWTAPGGAADTRGPIIESLQSRDGYAVFRLVPWGGLEHDSTRARVHLIRVADGTEVGRWDAGAPTPSPVLGDGGDVLLIGLDGSRRCLVARLHPLGGQGGQPVAFPGCAEEVALANGRIWALARGRIVSFVPGGPARTHVELGRLGASGLLVDDRSVAYQAPECDAHPALRVVSLTARVARPTVRRCPVRPARRRVPAVRYRGDPETTATVTLDCPRGCSGELRLRRGGKALTAGPAPFEQTRRRAKHTLLLYDEADRLLRSKRRLRVRLRIRRVDRAAPDPGPKDYLVTLAARRGG